MSVASPRNRDEISPELLARLQRMITGLVAIGLVVGAGWLGIVLAPHMGKILLTALAIVLLWALVVSVVDFFRDS